MAINKIPETTEPFGLTMVDLFWSFVKKKAGKDSCWEWQGFKNPWNYGIFSFLGKQFLAHRVSYAIVTGEVRPGFQVCHRCDNPPCVRPSHLFQGTAYDNCQDAKMKGRTNAPRGENHNSVVLDEKKVIAIHGARLTYSQIMKKYGISKGCVMKIRTGRTWKHLGLGKSCDRRIGT